MATTLAAPRWDLGFLFSSPVSPEFDLACQNCYGDLEALVQLFDRLGIRKGGPDAKAAETFGQTASALNEFMIQAFRISAFLSGLVTTNSYDQAAQAKASEFQLKTTDLWKLRTRLTAWIGDQDIERMLQESQVARDHEYMIRRAHFAAQHLLSPEEEALAADLSLTGSSAWQKLHGNMTSQLQVKVGDETLPMSVVRNKAYDSDRDVRREAYMAELDAWKKVEVPLAACMNGIKGETSLLAKKRGWPSPVAMACFNANIDEQTLDALMTAAHESFPSFRRYLQAKARMLGLEKLAWFDLFAPVGGEERSWEYEEAAQFVKATFGTYSAKMAEFAQSMFDNQRIDAEARGGKRDGAYCMGVPPTDSLIMMNFKPSFGSVSTLAHELGHGYHNLCLQKRTLLQRATPATLAETASIFCETIIRQAVLAGEFSESEKLSVLEASLQGSCQVVVDITSRFLFEKSIFDKRSDRELSAEEICDAMVDAQKATYGDGLDPEFLHPYMWSVKPHYYGSTFYNFPYMFGLLFGLGLYAVYEQDAEAFKARYDDLLSSTGLADAASLAARFGIDIRTPDFWRGSLRLIDQDVHRFEAMVK
ncbi:MAG TPA: M3 family oligoendopeptidase [Fimbriimonadaceae bacterium]|nr:M3 family oligoendopeptidase [Fimbriimonadaceae bacterium]